MREVDRKTGYNLRNLIPGKIDSRTYIKVNNGYSLVFDEDIARRLCTKSELLWSDNGRRAPNKNEQWLDVQARALYQACLRLREAFEFIKNKK